MAVDCGQMRFFYGDSNELPGVIAGTPHPDVYLHAPGEVYPSQIDYRQLRTSDGVRWGSDLLFEVTGDFVEDGVPLDEAGVDAKIAELEDKYADDYWDFGFLLSDDSYSQHVSFNDTTNNLSGNLIVNRSWRHLLPNEYANTRSFSITFQARYLESYNDILEFHEQVTKVGTGGPLFRMYALANGTPVRQDITANSPVYHLQRGTIVADGTLSTGWINPPAPLWPAEEMQWLRKHTQVNPRFHGDLNFVKGTHYTTLYEYKYWRPTSSPVWGPPWYP